MIKEVTKQERDAAVRYRSTSRRYFGNPRGRTFLKVQGKWYETTGASLREIVEFQLQKSQEARQLRERQLSLL